VYVTVVLLGDARAWSGSDAGGRVATVKAMADHGRWVPDVGYWAAAADPTGRFHPLLYTERLGSHWVQATSLPLVYAGRTLWPLGGPTALLVIPVVSGLAAAWAARRIAISLGSRTGWPAFWLVGLATPVAFYSGDFWEHAPGVALALVAVALYLGGTGAIRTTVVGTVAGLAAVVRTEMLVYVAAFVIAALVVSQERRRIAAAWRTLPLAAGAFASVVLLERILERVLLGSSVAAARSASNVSAAGSELGARTRDALVTSIGLRADDSRAALTLGAVLLLGLIAVAIGVRTGRAIVVRAGVVVAVAVYVVRAADGLGFVPGFVATAPLSVVGALVPASKRSKVLVGTALIALPFVWMFQWRGQLFAQWGGRYVLLSGVLLTIVASMAIDNPRGPCRGIAVVTMLALAASAFGVAWHVRRTNAYASAVADIERIPPDVVIISRIAHLGREAGAFYGDHRWLTAVGPRDLVPAAVVAHRLGVDRIAVVLPPGDGGPDLTAVGYRRSGTGEVELLGFQLPVVRFVRR
jgi:hypothetical protein